MLNWRKGKLNVIIFPLTYISKKGCKTRGLLTHWPIVSTTVFTIHIMVHTVTDDGVGGRLAVFMITLLTGSNPRQWL